MSRPFLTAHWSDLAIVTYAVDPSRLAPFLPRDAGIDLDTRDDLAAFGGPRGEAALLSLVAFRFRRTRVWGVAWPLFVNFPEINLRFYVRRGGRRGVMFIREFVPRAAISFIARRFYGEPYQTAPIEADISRSDGRIRAEYILTYPVRDRGLAESRRHVLRLTADDAPGDRVGSPLDDWIKEHQWGYTADPRGGAWVYEVRHPRWRTHAKVRAEIDFGFGDVYGPAWADLAAATPISIMLAEGSAVEVLPRTRAVPDPYLGGASSAT